MSSAEDRAVRLFRALGSPVRLRILLAIADRERATQPGPGLCVHDLVELLGAPQPLVSQHLRVLREVGLLAARRSGRESVYTLADDHVIHIITDALVHVEEHHHVGGTPQQEEP